VAARTFATNFNDRLVIGGPAFIDGVAAARVAARGCGGNTWAAYQCYGDPDWKYRRTTGDAQRPTAPPPAQELSSIASPRGLILALDTLAVRSEYLPPDTNSNERNQFLDEQAVRLRYLEDTFAQFWQGNGEVSAAFGQAWAKTGRFDEAIGWFERARTAADGASSLAAIEQLANLRVRRAWKWAARGGDEVAHARKEIAEAMALLDTLLAVGATDERESLYGSAYKRLALIEAAAGRPEAEAEAIAEMKKHYEAAERIALTRAREDKTDRVNDFYPAMNRIAAELALEGGTGQTKALDA
jgi:tetratricopeptide (TPR) repeat protein